MKKRKRPTQQKSKTKPPSGFKKRTRKRGYRARKLIREAKGRKKRTLGDLKTAIDIKDDIGEKAFVNLVLSIGWSSQEAYTFYFSSP